MVRLRHFSDEDVRAVSIAGTSMAECALFRATQDSAPEEDNNQALDEDINPASVLLYLMSRLAKSALRVRRGDLSGEEGEGWLESHKKIANQLATES